MLQSIAKYINNILIIITLLIGLVTIIVFNFIPSVGNSLLQIKSIDIEGSIFSDQKLIKETIKDYKNKTLIYFPIREYKSKIEELDWIKRVSIKRIFPNTISIKVIENLPFAIFINGFNRYLIDDDGEIISLKPDDSNYEELLQVTGLDGNLNFSDLIREINISYPEIMNDIIEVDFIEKRRWDLVLKQNIKIKLPEKNSSYQLEKLKQLQQDQKIFNSNIIEIDLREIGRATIKVPGGEELQTGLDEV